jgi:hypothetical protein
MVNLKWSPFPWYGVFLFHGTESSFSMVRSLPFSWYGVFLFHGTESSFSMVRSLPFTLYGYSASENISFCYETRRFVTVTQETQNSIQSSLCHNHHKIIGSLFTTSLNFIAAWMQSSTWAWMDSFTLWSLLSLIKYSHLWTRSEAERTPEPF